MLSPHNGPWGAAGYGPASICDPSHHYQRLFQGKANNILALRAAYLQDDFKALYLILYSCFKLFSKKTSPQEFDKLQALQSLDSCLPPTLPLLVPVLPYGCLDVPQKSQGPPLQSLCTSCFLCSELFSSIFLKLGSPFLTQFRTLCKYLNKAFYGKHREKYLSPHHFLCIYPASFLLMAFITTWNLWCLGLVTCLWSIDKLCESRNFILFIAEFLELRTRVQHKAAT